jgi:hypothetical protein
MRNTGFCSSPWVLPSAVNCLGAAVAALALGLNLTATAAEPLEIGSARQVFIDGRFMAETQNVTLEVHVPRKTGEWTIKPEHPWERGGVGPYSNVLHDGHTYHMWYHVMDDAQWDQGPTNGCICYARSSDGIQWEKPSLGLTTYAGSRSNNIVVGHGAAGLTMGQDGGMVFLDPTAGPAERFRLACRFDSLGQGVHILSSPDGIHWRVTHTNIVNYREDGKRHHLDSQNIVFWDDRARKYVVYGRRNLFEDGVQGRGVARAESDKLGEFSGVQDMPVVIGPEPGDRWVDYYSSSALKYPWAQDAYYMFPQAYFHYLGGEIPEFPKQTPVNAGPLHTQFGASRDGIKWNRYDRRPFVPLGMKGEFDWASARMIHGLVPDTSGREMFMYYRASDWLHGWDRNENNKALLTQARLGADQNIAVISRVVLRRDGFIAVYAPRAGGQFTTEPLRFTGSKLVLNVDTSAEGTVRVALLDVKGNAIEGLGLKDCEFIHTANEINRVVKWKGNADVSRLAGKPIRLRIAMKNSHLYAFQFAGN